MLCFGPGRRRAGRDGWSSCPSCLCCCRSRLPSIRARCRCRAGALLAVPVAGARGGHRWARRAPRRPGSPLAGPRSAAWCSVFDTSTAPPPNTANSAISSPAAGMNETGPRAASRPGDTAAGKPERVNGSARSATSARYATAPGEVSRSSDRTWKPQPGRGHRGGLRREQGGRVEVGTLVVGADRAGAEVAADQLALGARSARPRSRSAGWPAPGKHPSRGRAVSTVPSAELSLVRARDASSWAWLGGTPSTSARSAPVQLVPHGQLDDLLVFAAERGQRRTRPVPAGRARRWAGPESVTLIRSLIIVMSSSSADRETRGPSS